MNLNSGMRKTGKQEKIELQDLAGSRVLTQKVCRISMLKTFFPMLFPAFLHSSFSFLG